MLADDMFVSTAEAIKAFAEALERIKPKIAATALGCSIWTQKRRVRQKYCLLGVCVDSRPMCD